MDKRADDIKPGKDIDLGHMPDAVTVGKWDIIMSRPLMFPFMSRTWFLKESIVRDQDNNCVIVYLCKLLDHETYEWKDWMKPSLISRMGGYYNPELPNSLNITDTCFKFFRLGACQAFIETENAMKTGVVLDTTKRSNEKLDQESTPQTGGMDLPEAPSPEVETGQTEKAGRVSVLDAHGRVTD